MFYTISAIFRPYNGGELSEICDKCLDTKTYRKTSHSSMVAKFCHHMSDNYVDSSDLYVGSSVIYVDLSEKYTHNSSLISCFCIVLMHRTAIYLSIWKIAKNSSFQTNCPMFCQRVRYNDVRLSDNYVDLSDNYVDLSDTCWLLRYMSTAQIMMLLSQWHWLGTYKFLRFVFWQMNKWVYIKIWQVNLIIWQVMT